ncbi:hypothetical protein [uncultured Litoreibacter sp.]|uniref:hypothetical protein n=1 Tax=uncultured Litoreibacter sp. TaxID=1392394 RepID=UPI002634408E|nr:hypothetical protein [uncultured Litoreibacter sp.]
MISSFIQFIILICAMVASGGLGFWVARQQMLSDTGSTKHQLDKMAETIEQLRERATQAEAEKVRALIASDRDRKRAEAWRPNSQVHPAE